MSPLQAKILQSMLKNTFQFWIQKEEAQKTKVGHFCKNQMGRRARIKIEVFQARDRVE